MNSRYVEFLKKEIFKVEEYNQFKLLFESLGKLLETCSGEVVILERSYIYGGRSIFAPLVQEPACPIVIDYRPVSADTRSNYQGSWIENCGFEFPQATESVRDLGTGYCFSFESINADTLIIPNVLHHCRDFPGLMANLQAALPNLRRVFIFDSYLREAHQTPDDFCRYTPSALTLVMRAQGFGQVKLQETGNVFDGILYLISQARWLLENAPELAQLNQSIAEIIPRLRHIRDKECYRALGRPNAFLSTAYALSFER